MHHRAARLGAVPAAVVMPVIMAVMVMARMVVVVLIGLHILGRLGIGLGTMLTVIRIAGISSSNRAGTLGTIE